ncbi:hypothetical protein O181_030808 [Austropuccinia psidii MF-1]|uniref:Uncharacterized protein n=1 Tax=Austropuccinia psidii MF-1 TaxID=1389203 RepID=A0A9Q3H408_9BASI|nr:hypothetical protein [Austropuccinia psidii MF-1]
MEHGEQEVQPGIPLGRTWSKFPEDMSQRDRLQRPYGNPQRLYSHQAVQTPGGGGKQDKGESSHYPSYSRTDDSDRAYGKESPFFAIPGSFQEKTRTQGQKQDNLQPKEERVRTNDPKAVGFGERSAQEQEAAVYKYIISTPLSINITPTQIENNVVTPESNLNSDALLLQMSHNAEKNKKELA